MQNMFREFMNWTHRIRDRDFLKWSVEKSAQSLTPPVVHAFTCSMARTAASQLLGDSRQPPVSKLYSYRSRPEDRLPPASCFAYARRTEPRPRQRSEGKVAIKAVRCRDQDVARGRRND